MDNPRDLVKIREIFKEESSRHGLKGVLGVAAFDSVYRALILNQQKVLKEICGDDFSSMRERGSFISIAYAYPEYAIDSIALRKDDGFDKEAWNIYSCEYRRLNDALDATTVRLAEETGGIAISATLTGVAGEVKRVEDYYGRVVSHMVAAEQSGIGWRGKNELIVNPQFSCAIRLASVVSTLPLERTVPSHGECGSCRACLDACPYLRFKDNLVNYREQCWRYIVALGLNSDVCGKCVKACYRDSIYSDRFRL